MMTMFVIAISIICTMVIIVLLGNILDFTVSNNLILIIAVMGVMIMVMNMLTGDFGMRRSTRVFSISNVEERAKKLEEMGVEKLLKKSKAILIDESKRGNKLYMIEKMIPNYPLKYLVYEDPSTKGKIYGCFVKSDFAKADEAMAWKFEMSLDEYENDLIYEA